MAADDKPSRSHHTPRRAASQSRASRPRRRSHRQQEAEPPPEAEPEEAPQCAVVGIGASAGGLEALQEFV
jgi:chemotaxis response regulator CheB